MLLLPCDVSKMTSGETPISLPTLSMPRVSLSAQETDTVSGKNNVGAKGRQSLTYANAFRPRSSSR